MMPIGLHVSASHISHSHAACFTGHLYTGCVNTIKNTRGTLISAKANVRKMKNPMRRCKHENVDVIEEWRGFASWRGFRDNEPVWTELDPESLEPTGFVMVECMDCGYSKEINRSVTPKGAARVPKWIKRALDKVDLPLIERSSK